MDEIWAEVPGYSDYFISDAGRVASKKFGWKILRASVNNKTNKNPYLKVNLNDNGIMKKFFIHKLVAHSFLGPTPKGMAVIHRDGNTLNNRLENIVFSGPSRRGYRSRVSIKELDTVCSAYCDVCGWRFPSGVGLSSTRAESSKMTIRHVKKTGHKVFVEAKTNIVYNLVE